MAEQAAEEFEPQDCEVAQSHDGQWIKMVFRRDDGGVREIVMRREGLPTFVAQLTEKIGLGQVTPISRDALHIGRSFRSSAWAVRRLPDGGARLTLHVTFEDEGRTVTIPLDLSKEDVASIVSQIG